MILFDRQLFPWTVGDFITTTNNRRATISLLISFYDCLSSFVNEKELMYDEEVDKSFLWFQTITRDDVGIAGVKGANLGEMTRAGLPVPNGFVILSTAYFKFLRENKLIEKINNMLTLANDNQPESIMQLAAHIKKVIVSAPISDDLLRDIDTAYHVLGGALQNTPVAVRASATTEDLPSASFIGQQETFLNVTGEANLVIKIKECWASAFDAHALSHRHRQKVDHFRSGVAVIVQKMVNAEHSGVLFTIDPITQDKSKIVIEAINGLEEPLKQGSVTPDHYEIRKDTLEMQQKSVLPQQSMLKYVNGVKTTIELSQNDATKQKISDQQIIQLVELGKKLEQHYLIPQDVEWAIENNKVSLLQTRPLTAHTLTATPQLSPIAKNLKFLLKGVPGSRGIVSGPVKIVRNTRDLAHVHLGDVVVASQTMSDYVLALKKAFALITDKGGRTSHAALTAREIGIPAVVGTTHATQILRTGMMVTVNGTKGEIYQGATGSTSDQQAKHCNIQTATKIYVTTDRPALATTLAQECADGIGMLHAETFLKEIGVHPLQAIQTGKKQQYIDAIASQLAFACKAFYPRPVLYRTSDLQTTDYALLTGGKEFEPTEHNPLLGFHGTFRYVHMPEIFKLELAAIKQVREKMHFDNLWLTLPFVRNVTELRSVKQIMTASGLHRSPHFKLWATIATPANVISIDEFLAEGIDGVMLDTEILTTLFLGTDRNNSHVASAYDDMDPSVVWALEHVIRLAHKQSVATTISGHAPLVHPSLLDKLITSGLTSICVPAHDLDRIREHIAHAERTLIENRHQQKIG